MNFTTKQIREFFDLKPIEEIESYTCSVLCAHCRERIWYMARYTKEVPATDTCPYCQKITATW